MRIVVTGTDTGVGKTLFCAALAGAIGGHYWKPIQAGVDPATDSAIVAALAPKAKIAAEVFRLTTHCSPHRAAEIDNIAIDVSNLAPPAHDPLIIEGAGGPLVPLTRDVLFADVFAAWQLPVVIVARTALGTINHSLLTIEALRSRSVPILGVAFSGEPQEDSEAIIASIGGVKRLGRLPILDECTPQLVSAAFADHFDLSDFA